MSSSSSNQRRSRAAASDGFQRTRADHATELAEDYVELIADLTNETGEARTVDIASRLGVTHVTVTNTINRLKRDGLVTSEPYRSIFLTDKGRQLSEAARQRHNLVVDFLVALGVPATDAEIDAEGIEHHIGDSTVAAMSRYLKQRHD